MNPSPLRKRRSRKLKRLAVIVAPGVVLYPRVSASSWGRPPNPRLGKVTVEQTIVYDPITQLS